jgi:hypothetical protein
VGPRGFIFGARHRRHAVRNVGDQPARVLILSAPSCGPDEMFAELDAATAAGLPEIERLVAICAKYGVAIEQPTDWKENSMLDKARTRVAHLVDLRDAETIDVLGPTIQFLTPPGPSDDDPCVMRGIIPPGVPVPLHSHRDPETFS